MRTEQLHLLLYGALLFAFILVTANLISSRRLKLHITAFFLALGLGVIIVPGHGEIVVAPLLASCIPPIRFHLVILGSIYFLVWWGVAFFILSKIRYYSTKPAA